MNGQAVINEFAKMRGLHIWPLAGLLFALNVVVVLYATVPDPSFQPGTAQGWNLLLNGIVEGSLVAVPLLVAVLASRQVDIEHTGNGWLMSATSGEGPGVLSRAKFVSLGMIVGLISALTSVLALLFGMRVLGDSAAVPLGRWASTTGALLVVNLVLLAIHILIAVRIENQLVGIGIGLVGLIFALIASGLPKWVDHMVPWGYYALIVPSEYRGTALVATSPGHVGVGVLGAVVAVLFALFTGRFDRLEV